MAIGDYSKTTYANGVAPAINATNLNNNEDKTKELDIAVSSIETWQENEKPVSTSSRILDLTGDRAPAIPDDPAGVTYLRQYGEFSLTDYVPVNNITESLVSGNYRGTFTGAGGASVGISRASYAGKLFVSEIYFSSAGTFKLAGLISGTYTEFKSYEIASPGTVLVSTYIPTAATSFYLSKTVGYTAGDYFEVRGEYTGTGAYLSKLIDRAGVPWTNYGALPVDGPFGKGLQFNGAQYLQAPGPMIGTTGTVAIKFKYIASSRTQIILFNDNGGGLNGQRLYITNTGSLQVILGGSSSFTQRTIGTLTAGNDYTLGYRYNGATNELDFTLNGVKTVSSILYPLSIGTVPLYIGCVSSFIQFMYSTIYALRADSRVWTDEEIARWSRDPYSEDSGLVDAFSLNFSNLPTFADNAAAIAGNLPAGKLYKTSTGNVLVRY